MVDLVLPFRPFTVEEVRDITGLFANVLDRWWGKILPLKLGEDGVTRGLDWMGTFAAFVGRRFLDEGGDHQRAMRVARYVAGMTLPHVEECIKNGVSFPGVPPRGYASMIPPPKSRLGRALNLSQLLGEFRGNLARVFPNG